MVLRTMVMKVEKMCKCEDMKRFYRGVEVCL